MPKIDYSTRGEIHRASRSREGGAPLAVEHKTKTELEIRATAAGKFELDVAVLAKWEAPPHISLYEPEAVRWIPDFQPGPYFIFFDDPVGSIFEVAKPWQLLVIFERVMRKGPYYITNRFADYLITIDQNHLIHGQGTAEIWLRTGVDRIYKLLGTPKPDRPDALAVTHITVEQFGRKLCFQSELKQAPPQPFKLILDGCDSVEWRTLTHRPPNVDTLDYIYLAELNHSRHRVSITASSFRLFTHCERVVVEKGT
jgi:hypothetical protein